MAEEPIRKEDIIDLTGTQESINELIKTLENLSIVMQKDLKVAADELTKSLQGVNVATKEGQEVVKNASIQAENLAAQEKERTRLDKETIQLKARLSALDSDQANSNAKLRVAIENKNKAMKEAARLDDSAEGSVNRMRAKLKELTAEYNRLGAAARKDVAPAIKKVTEELKKAEGAIGNNTRNVGNYKQAIIGAAKQMLGFVSPIALATAALNKLKEAFLATESGAKFLSKWQAGWKAAWQNLTADMSMKEFTASIKESAAVGAEYDKIRIGNRGDLKVIAALEAEVAILRYKSADATESEATQLMYLNRALAKEDELIKYRIADKQEELDWVNKSLIGLEKNTILLDRKAQLEADILSIQGDRSLRIMTKSSNLKKKIADKERGDLIEIERKTIQEVEEIKLQGLIKNEDFYERQAELVEINAKREADAIKETERIKQEAVNESFAAISGSLTTLSNLYEVAKQRELSAAGDNAKKREEIERAYSKKQQIFSIGQALINGAMAITEIWRKWASNPVLAGIFTAVSSAQTLAQVAIIRAQKFAKGGSGILEGPVHASGGIQIPGVGEAEGGEHFAITSRAMTSKYGSKMLDAVSNSINQGKFFEVWNNVSKSMGTTDPYTKKMYELMNNTPTVYMDTEGSTVKEYPDGRKYVIKHYNRN